MNKRIKQVRLWAAGFTLAAVVLLLAGCSNGASQSAGQSAAPAESTHAAAAASPASSLPVPEGGALPVAFVLGPDAEVLDFAGPFEVFVGAWTPEGKTLFKPYVVAATMEPVRVGGGMRVVPDYTFANAPQPKVIVIPAMTDDLPKEMLDWIRTASKGTDVTMSVCNGAFVLARTGLLDGLPAVAHHGGYFRFAGMFPNVQLKRGARYVESGNLASAGGISSGIDLALRVVERYVGRDIVHELVDAMEYQGKGWLDPNSNDAYATMAKPDPQNPVCPLCQMTADKSISSTLKGTTYYFCSASEKKFFDDHLDVAERFMAEDAALAANSGR